MSKPPKPTPTLDLSTLIVAAREKENAPAQLASKLAHAYRTAQEGRRQHTLGAVRFGLLALIAKEVLPRGEFGPWIDAVILEEAAKLTPVSVSQAACEQRRSRYMRLAVRFAEDVPIKVAGSVWLSDGVLDSATDTLREAVEKWIAGRSLTDIYQDEGILRERTPHQRHTPPNKTPEQREQMEFSEICKTWDTFEAEILVHAHKAKSHLLLPRERRERLLDYLVPITVELRESLKGEGK